MQQSNLFNKNHWSQRLVILGMTLFAIAIALWQMVPPNVIPATAPLTEFSADRAMPHLKVIAQAPSDRFCCPYCHAGVSNDSIEGNGIATRNSNHDSCITWRWGKVPTPQLLATTTPYPTVTSHL